jgi:hypothetical protein
VHAAPAPQFFALTIHATSVADFDHTDCNASFRAVGVRTVSFRTDRPTLVRFIGGRLRPVVVRGLRGAVNLSGTNTSNLVCGQEPNMPESCAQTIRAFTNARVTFTSAAAGSITVRAPRLTLRRGLCPQEPGEVTAFPLGPAPGPLHVPVATLTNPRIERITLSASARRTKNYAAPERGFVKQRTTWTLTLARTGR